MPPANPTHSDPQDPSYLVQSVTPARVSERNVANAALEDLRELFDSQMDRLVNDVKASCPAGKTPRQHEKDVNKARKQAEKAVKQQVENMQAAREEIHLHKTPEYRASIIRKQKDAEEKLEKTLRGQLAAVRGLAGDPATVPLTDNLMQGLKEGIRDAEQAERNLLMHMAQSSPTGSVFRLVGDPNATTVSADGENNNHVDLVMRAKKGESEAKKPWARVMTGQGKDGKPVQKIEYQTKFKTEEQIQLGKFDQNFRLSDEGSKVFGINPLFRPFMSQAEKKNDIVKQKAMPEMRDRMAFYKQMNTQDDGSINPIKLPIKNSQGLNMAGLEAAMEAGIPVANASQVMNSLSDANQERCRKRITDTLMKNTPGMSETEALRRSYSADETGLQRFQEQLDAAGQSSSASNPLANMLGR